MTNQEIVQKLWNECNVLRDDGVSYQDYITELTYILFLKMSKEQGQEEESKKKNSESNKANWTDDKRKSFGEIRRGRNNPNSRMICQYDKNGNFIRVWGSISDASRSLNIDVSNISACARGKYKTAGGYIWRYTPDYLNN